MTLELRVASAAEEASPELVDMTRRFWISVALAIPLIALEMSDMTPGRPLQRVMPAALRTWTELALATPVVLFASWPLFVRAWASIVNRSLNMFTLIGMGVGVAYGYSLVAAIFPNLFPDSFRAADGTAPVYFEAEQVSSTVADRSETYAYLLAAVEDCLGHLDMSRHTDPRVSLQRLSE
jgi:Cu+-exporting ATPase